MTKNLDDIGLKSVADHFDLFFVDLWGVVHNGIELYKESTDALEKLLERNKELVLLTNAPRPNNDVINFLKKMGLDQKYYSKVYTSGEAALMPDKLLFAMYGSNRGDATKAKSPTIFIFAPNASFVPSGILFILET